MRHILSIIFLLAALTSFAQPQKQNAFKFIDSVLRDSVCNLEITEFDFPDDIRDILLRFNNGIAANQEWFKQYAGRVPAGQPLPYDARFGITPEEYGKIRNMDKVHPALKVIDTQRITILRQDGRISFKGEGDGRILDYLGIYQPENKPLLRIQYQDMENGVSRANPDLAGYIH